MKVLAKIFRGLIVGILIVAVGIPSAMYLLLSSDWAQERLCAIAESELTELFGTDVRVGRVKLDPFSRMRVCDVSIDDDNGVKALAVDKIETRFEVYDFIFRRKTIIDYVVVDGLDLHLYKETPQSSLNIAGIIARLKSEEKRDKSMFDLRINSIDLNDCSLSYDVLSEEESEGRFNPSHISISGIETEIFAPRISNDCFRLWLRSLSCTESSGLDIRDLTCRLEITDSEFVVNDLKVELPRSILAFNEVRCDIDGVDGVTSIGREIPLTVGLENGTIWLPDLSPLYARLADFPAEVELSLQASGTLDTLTLSELRLIARNEVDFRFDGVFTNLQDLNQASANTANANIRISNGRLLSFIRANRIDIPTSLERFLENSETTRVSANIQGSLQRADGKLTLLSDIGSVEVTGNVSKNESTDKYRVNLNTAIDSVMLSDVLPSQGLGVLTADIVFAGDLGSNSVDGSVETVIDAFDFKGYTYRDIHANISMTHNGFNGTVTSSDPNCRFNASVSREKRGTEQYVDLNCWVLSLRPDSLHLSDKYPGHKLSTRINASGHGTSIDSFQGVLELASTSFCNAAGNGLVMNNLSLETDNSENFGHAWLESDYINGEINGQIRPGLLKRDFMAIIGNVVPALADSSLVNTPLPTHFNDFDYEFSINNVDSVCRFFKLPVVLLDKGTVSGRFDRKGREISLIVDLPWIQKKKDLIENTMVTAYLNGNTGAGNAYITTHMPTIKGPMDMVADISGSYGRFESNFDWSILRDQPLHGIVDFDTELDKDPDGELVAKVVFNPSSITFGGDVWYINSSTILYKNSRIFVDDFAMNSLNQSLRANGTAGKLVSDELDVSFRSLNLINIFETLGINNALIGGLADGNVHGTALLSPEREFYCHDLEVKNVSYNYCVLGDADGIMWFDNVENSIKFNVDVLEPSLRHSTLEGFIKPMSKEMDLVINADRVAVGFMQPFMSAFASGVSGWASGYAHIYGTFEDIDMDGSIYADSLRLKMDFTNVWYNATDSFHIYPGRIPLENLRIYDDYGNSAVVNGTINHTYFHNPTFDINVEGAKNLLCYDVPKSMSPIWYGRIFGDGGARVVGVPNRVDIYANIKSAKNTVFTFELSDFEDVLEYSFITFRDATPTEITDSIIQVNLVPEIVDHLRGNKKNNINKTDYNIDLAVDITPDAKITIVMDPVGGDRIDSHGSGNMRMTYGSADNDVRLYGTYTLQSGDYNFTLQDIIIKNFTIDAGSSITFNGDPYAAKLDLQAYHTVNANLSDLDESFLTDKDLNTTNVPVRAIMHVTGDIKQPELDFDLGFPTLKSDIYRKVRSIVSTPEMMHKQIIYLLVLNRFFTPEYMSGTRGDELFAVASSTLSGQLSSMLGKLNEHWSISPSLRSDKGDFSDLEVDVNLSSNLLDNRLLFNGNFGYRDKSLNTNQFIGDFDIEYLLSRSGVWRLKAYNRYNDQNFYLRTAQTTQGLGLVFRRDFDNMFHFLRKRKKEETDTLQIDINVIEQTDSLPNQH